MARGKKTKQPVNVRLDARAIGLRIRKTRKAREWHLADLAARIGVSPKTVAAWECGARVPMRDSLVALAMLFRRRLDWLVHGTYARTQ